MAVNEKKSLLESSDELEPRVYEIGYTLIPTIREEDLDKEREALSAYITKLKGEILLEGKPELINLAYEMVKASENKKQVYSQGYFGWVKFSINPELIKKLEGDIEKNQNVLRYLLVKTRETDTARSENPLGSILVKKEMEEVKDDKIKSDKGEAKLETAKDKASDEIDEKPEKLDKLEE